MSTIAASLCIAIMAVAAAFHFYWGAGGKLGRAVSLPQTEDGRPIIEMPALGAYAVGLALSASISLVLVYHLNITQPLPSSLLRAGIAALALLFSFRALSWHTYVGLFKKVRNTRFAAYDTWLYSPLCLLMAICLVVLLAKET